ncbi:MAG TPA: ATP-binding protein [Gemmatimonadales bacterium]|nr:ATP-binding protein [Gemmatimonadales bacterium]
MKLLGSIFGDAAARLPLQDWPLERIHKLPHTTSVMGELATLDEQPTASDRRRFLRSLLLDAQERDRLAAELPEGCWCFGRGGSGPRAVMVPGQDVPMVLTAYCGCAIGDARRILDGDVRERGRAYAQEIQLLGIWEGARVPERFNDCSFETFPATSATQLVVAEIMDWLDSAAWALVLLGEFGVGKTGLAISALRDAAERRHPGLFVKTPDLLARIRATYGKGSEVSEQDVLESLRTVDYLVLDDVGAEHATDWATSMLFQVLDDRHDHQRKTILTTNLDITGLGLHMGERTLHRFKEGAVFLTVDGPNLRGNAG